MQRATKERLAKAVEAVLRFNVDHGDDCAHRNCDDTECEGGEGCDGDYPAGTPCECFRAQLDEMIAAADCAVAEAPAT